MMLQSELRVVVTRRSKMARFSVCVSDATIVQNTFYKKLNKESNIFKVFSTKFRKQARFDCLAKLSNEIFGSIRHMLTDIGPGLECYWVNHGGKEYTDAKVVNSRIF